MTGQCIPYARIPGTTRLVEDFLYAFNKVACFYPYDPADLTAVRRRLDRLNYPAQRRALLVNVIREQNPGDDRVERLGKPGTVAVVTGQQVGLFTGPAYTFYKALTAAHLAEQLTADGIPAVPVFWLATEDHDYAEVSRCWVFDAGGRPVRIDAGFSGAGRPRPTGWIAPAEWPVAQLAAAICELPFGAAVLDVVSQVYLPGRACGAAFADLLGRLLGPRRPLFFDPLHPEARQLLAPGMAMAAERAPVLARAVMDRTEQLERCGYHAQVRVNSETPLLFLMQDGERVPVRLREHALEAGGATLDPAQVAARAKDLSAGALLRPALQDWLFPTAVSVVGPAEVAYLAQAAALYEALGVDMPVWRLRASCTLVEKRALRLLDRYRLELPDFFAGEQALRDRVASRLQPDALSGILGRSRAEILAALDRIADRLSPWEGPAVRAFQKSRSKIEYQLAKIERSIAREALRRDEQARRDAAWLYNQLFPRRRLQERVYSIIAFVARHGFELTGRLYDTITWDCREHRMVVI